MAGIADIEEQNNVAALEGGPVVGPVQYALLEAMRRGTDRWSEPDFREWVAVGRKRYAALHPQAPDPVPEKGSPKRG